MSHEIGRNSTRATYISSTIFTNSRKHRFLEIGWIFHNEIMCYRKGQIITHFLDYNFVISIEMKNKILRQARKYYFLGYI